METSREITQQSWKLCVTRSMVSAKLTHTNYDLAETEWDKVAASFFAVC